MNLNSIFVDSSCLKIFNHDSHQDENKIINFELLYKCRLTDKESVWCKEGIISADIWLRHGVFQIADQGIYLFNLKMVDEV